MQKVIIFIKKNRKQKFINLLKITGGYTEPTEGDGTTEASTGATTGSSTVNITVNDETRTGISKNETAYSGITLSGKVGERLDVKLSISDPTTDNVIYTFASSDEKVVSVDKNGMVTALKNGKATITITVKNNKHRL